MQNAYGAPGGAAYAYGPPGEHNAPPGAAGMGSSPALPGGADAERAVAVAAAGPMDSQTRCLCTCWFGAGCCVTFGAGWGLAAAIQSAIGDVQEFLLKGPAEVVQLLCLLVFGVVVSLLDFPFADTSPTWRDVRDGIGKYVHLLTRLTGKGLVLVFLGTNLWALLWENDLSPLLAVLIGVLCVLVGFVTFAKGVGDSRKLNKMREYFRKVEHGPSELQQRYGECARTQGVKGLTHIEFNKLASQTGGLKFQPGDLRYIFNALSSRPHRDYVSLEDLENWVKTPYMAIL